MTFKLTPEGARRKWAEALRSGVFKQTKRRLKNASGHCCLGVACELFVRHEGIGAWTVDGFNVDDETNNECLPSDVRDWLGLTDDLGEIEFDQIVMDESGEVYVDSFVDDDTLAELNDGGFTFSQIADLIDGGIVRVQND